MTEREIFLAVLDLQDAADRAAFLERVCEGDSARRARIDALLASHDGAASFLGSPAVQPVPLPDLAGALTQDVGAGAGTTGGGTSGGEDGSENELAFLQPSPRPDALGRIGHYDVLQVLGKGGFGIVFRAFDDTLQRVVAIKVLNAQIAATSPARKRFLREARSSAKVGHENVVQVYEVVEQPLPYLVMEFIPGETLQQRLERMGPLDALETVQIGRQIAEALAAAHGQGLIHRDIKPGNILIESSPSERVKITDFGLARAADDASMTQSGMIMGTPLYMAPEQAHGNRVDHRADLFSLGSVLYTMCSGRPPFRASSTLAVLTRVANDTPRAITEIIPEVPQWLCDIISQLHAKDPSQRFQTAREVANLLTRCEAKLKAKQEVQFVLTASTVNPVMQLGSAAQPAPAVKSAPAAKPAATAKSVAQPAPIAPKTPSRRRRWEVLAAVVMLGIFTLATTEFAGITHLFRSEPPPPPVANETPAETEPVLAAKQDATAPAATDADGWVQLFNGKDLSGWKTHPDQPGAWKTEDGVLVGSTVASYLFSERGDYENFHLRVEAKINYGGDSGVFFRSPFSMRAGKIAGSLRPAGGYEAELHRSPAHAAPTGSIWNAESFGAPKLLWKAEDYSPLKNDDWMTLEIIAQDSHFITLVNGKQTADCQDSQSRFKTGHFALQVLNPETTVQFRKIEIKELTPPKRAFTNSIGMEFVIVPKGKSWLGGGDGNLGNKEVEIPADFYLGKYEVTQEEWEKVMGENPSGFSRKGVKTDAVKDIPDADLKRFPVEYVSWEDCQLFAAKLNTLEQHAGWVYRLPKNSEWEYACRGGPMADSGDSAFNFYFAKPANTLLPEQANFNIGTYENPIGLNRPCKVGMYAPNALGLFDMHGNVAEWCDDPWTTGMRVLHGGCWTNPTKSCTAVFGGIGPVRMKNRAYGLRLARVPAGAPAPQATAPLAAAPFTDADIQHIAALPALDQIDEVRTALMKRNPGFDGKLEPKIEGGKVTELSFAAEKVRDISPVRALTQLRVLACISQSGTLSDLSPLKGMQLTSLNLTGSSVSDLSPLKGMPLTWLHLHLCTQIRDLAPLAGLRLTYLNLHDGPQVADITPLKDMPLTELGLGGCPVKDLSPLKGMPLTTLVLDHCHEVGDLSPLKGMQLSRLHLSETKVRDLELLKGMPLTFLMISDTSISDLSPLKDMPLEDFRLNPRNFPQGLGLLREMKSVKTIGTGWYESWPAAEFWTRYDNGEFCVTDAWIKRVAALPALDQIEEVRKLLKKFNPDFDGVLTPGIEDGMVTTLNIEGKSVTDISPVRALVGMKVFWCQKAPLADISPLKGLRLTGAGFWATQVSDLSPLQGMKLEWLDLNGCAQVRDLAPLAGMPLKVLKLDYVQARDLGPLAGMPLTNLSLPACTLLRDLTPLKGMKITQLSCAGTAVTDLSPLIGMPLEDFRFTPGEINQGLDVVRAMKSLKTIGTWFDRGWPAEEFWTRYDKGEFGFADAWIKRVAALPAAEQVEEVRKELVKRNPDFDGKVGHRIENGVVTELRVVTDKVTNVAPIRVFNALRVLDLSGTETSNGQLADLTPLKDMNLSNLTKLMFDNTKIDDAGLAPFKNCKNLTGLWLSHTQVTNAAMANFEGCKDLQNLNLKYTKVDDAGLARFKDCKDLKFVELSGLKITDEALAIFKDCKGLNELWLSDIRITDAGLAHFKDCTTLTLLALGGTQVTDAGLANFKNCRDLTKLFLSNNPQVSDAGLAPFKGMPLKVLSITFTGITDLTPLQGMPLEGIFLTPKKITRGMDILRDMKSLKTIGIGWKQSWPAAEFWERYDKGEFTRPEAVNRPQ